MFKDPLVHSDTINSYCKELFNASGIKTFGVIEFDSNGNYIQLESHRDIHKLLQNSDMYKTMPKRILLESDFKLGFQLSKAKIQDPNNIINIIKKSYKLENSLGFTECVEQNNKFVIRQYYFCACENNYNVNNYYLNNLEQLKKFCYDFRKKFDTVFKNINNISTLEGSNKLYIDKFNQLCNDSYLSELKQGVFSYAELPFNLAQNIFLSREEKEIIFLYYHQFHIDQIAEKLDVSRKTIERRFQSIRKKLNCKINGHIIPALMK